MSTPPSRTEQLAPPARGARAMSTDAVILPGLIDLHGHPEFNVFAAWEPPWRFSNRYIWRSSDLYHQLVRDPQNELVTRLASGTQLRYAEVRALVGGVTAIQGASARTAGSPAEPLVRNVDVVLERHHADPYENVCRADPSWVELVLIGGDVTYGRDDWFTQITGTSQTPTHELVFAWAKPCAWTPVSRYTPTSPRPPSPTSAPRSSRHTRKSGRSSPRWATQQPHHPLATPPPALGAYQAPHLHDLPSAAGSWGSPPT